MAVLIKSKSDARFFLRLALYWGNNMVPHTTPLGASKLALYCLMHGENYQLQDLYNLKPPVEHKKFLHEFQFCAGCGTYHHTPAGSFQPVISRCLSCNGNRIVQVVSTMGGEIQHWHNPIVAIASELTLKEATILHEVMWSNYEV